MHCRHVQAQIDTRKNILNLLLLLLCKLPKSPVPLKPAGVEGVLDLGGLGFQANLIQVQDCRSSRVLARFCRRNCCNKHGVTAKLNGPENVSPSVL